MHEMHSMSSDHDHLLLDVDAARDLAGALRAGADTLADDRTVLATLLDDAGALLGGDRRAPLSSIDSARHRMDALAADLGRRVAAVDALRADVRDVDALSSSLARDDGRLDAAARSVLEDERERLVLRLAGGDTRLADRIIAGLGAGRGFDGAARAAVAAVLREHRVRAAMEQLGMHAAAARALVDRLDAGVAGLIARGHGPAEAAAFVAIAEDHALDIEVLAARAWHRGISLAEATGDALLARGFGLTLAEFDALDGLREHFAVFDTATGTGPDGRVSRADLEFVVAEPCFFTDGQVLAAELLLASPALFNRLDTADENDDVFGDDRHASPRGFGSLRPGDGLVADVDIEAFARKAQLHAVLGPYADRIDIADDPKAIVDGYRAEADFRAFLEKNPDLPPPVVVAAESMIEAGYFDESWWQENKGDLAMGAALVAGGVVVIASGGAASILVVAATSATAAATTTLAVNARTDDDAFDDVLANTASGFLIGMSTHSLAGGIGQTSAATTSAARVSGVLDATAGGTGIVLTGGFDLILPDSLEEPIKDIAEPVNTVASLAGALRGGREWAEAAGYVTVDDLTTTPGEVDD